MALAGLLLLVAGLCIGPMQETDLFFRVAAGEQFLRTGHLVHRNLFSFTYPDAPYLDSAWLFDTAAAALYRLGGFPAVVLGKTFVILAIATLAYRLCRSLGASKLTAATILAAAFLCMRERLVERPHLFSLLGEALLMGLLPHVVKGGRSSWLVLPLVVSWVNLHAGAFLAALMLALGGIGALLDRQPARVAFRFAAFAIASLALLAASPVGVGIFRYLTFHVGIFDIHPVDEFRNLTWRSDAPFVVFATATLALFVLSRRPSWTLRFPALGLLALGIWHVRFSADATVVLAIAAAPAFEDLASRFAAFRSRLVTVAFLAMVIAVTLIPRIAEARRSGRFASLDLDRASIPLAAIEFAREHGLRNRMYNDFETGAYLLWEGYPSFRVFVDPRLPAYPVELHRLLGRMDISRAEWTGAMDGLGVESALLDYAGINRRVAFWDPADWALVFRAKDSRVFLRRLPKWKGLIAQFEIPATFDFTVDNGARTLPIASPPAGSPVPACEWQFRLGDLYFDLEGTGSARAIAAYRSALAEPAGCLDREHELSGASWIGSLDATAGRFAEALPLLERALGLAPQDTAILAQRALALEGVGRTSEAADTWARVAKLAPGTPLGQRAAEKARRSQ
jgi:tetratricopeptide (TPR) repeat protein